MRLDPDAWDMDGLRKVLPIITTMHDAMTAQVDRVLHEVGTDWAKAHGIDPCGALLDIAQQYTDRLGKACAERDGAMALECTMVAWGITQRMGVWAEQQLDPNDPDNAIDPDGTHEGDR